MVSKIIEMGNAKKVYGTGEVKVNALDGVDFSVKKGEFVSIMGPSGSGKSTLLHVAGLLDPLTAGSLSVNGMDVSKMSDAAKTEFRLARLGFIFQFYSLLPELTAIENVHVPQMLLGKSNDELRRNSLEVLELLGIGNRAGSYPHQLSGGEQQRVSIARAIANKPDILLGDEPTAALDSKNAANVFRAFRELNEKLGHTVIIVTHEESLGAMADRGVWLKDGRVAKEKAF